MVLLIFSDIILVKLFPLKILILKTNNTYTHIIKYSSKHSPFLLKVLWCIIIIDKYFPIKNLWRIGTNSSKIILPHLIKTRIAGINSNSHWAFLTSWTEQVTLLASVGDLASLGNLLANCFDDTHSHCLSHVL